MRYGWTHWCILGVVWEDVTTGWHGARAPNHISHSLSHQQTGTRQRRRKSDGSKVLWPAAPTTQLIILHVIRRAAATRRAKRFSLRIFYLLSGTHTVSQSLTHSSRAHTLTPLTLTRVYGTSSERLSRTVLLGRDITRWFNIVLRGNRPYKNNILFLLMAEI